RLFYNFSLNKPALELELLKQAVFKVQELPGPEWEALAACWRPVQYRRKAIVTAAGDVERYVYFVLEGVQRAFYLEGEREATLVFFYPGSFGGVADSFML